MVAPVFFIKKKDGSLWLVQDYCALNTMMVKNKYPLPLVSELMSQLCKGDWSTRLQENSQLILQLVVMIQLTSRRILRD